MVVAISKTNAIKWCPVDSAIYTVCLFIAVHFDEPLMRAPGSFVQVNHSPVALWFHWIFQKLFLVFKLNWAEFVESLFHRERVMAWVHAFFLNCFVYFFLSFSTYNWLFFVWLTFLRQFFIYLVLKFGKLILKFGKLILKLDYFGNLHIYLWTKYNNVHGQWFCNFDILQD